MKLPLQPFFLQLSLLFYEYHSTNLQGTAKSTGDLQFEQDEPNQPASLMALSSVFYNWANLLRKPSEIGQIIQQLNITENCKAHTLEILFRLTSQEYMKKSAWVMQMIDSWGKFPDGILEGHLDSYGDYDECVSVDVSNLQFLGPIDNSEKYSTKFTGLYCTVRLQLSAFEQLQNATAMNNNLEETNSGNLFQSFMIYLSVGVCFPSSCSTADVNTIVGRVTPKIDPQANAMVLGTCRPQNSSDFRAGFWAMIGVLILLLVLTAIGTTLDLIQTKSKRESLVSENFSGRAFRSFSLIRNIKKLFKIETKREFNLECIHGIRTLTMLWIILYHTWCMLISVPIWNSVEAKKMLEKLYLSPILNGYIGVDTFLTVTGLLTCHSLLKSYERSRGRVSLIWLYVHRYVRLTPAYAGLVAVYATILPHLSSGPFWTASEIEGERCRANWWTNLLYLNNFIHTDDMCAGHGWYLAVDMQLYILAPLIVFPLWRHPKVGVGLLTFMTVIAILTPGLQSLLQHLLPTVIISWDFESASSDAYIKPWTYLQPYIAGIWMGCLLLKNSGKRVNLSCLQVATGWTFSIAVAMAVIYGIDPWFDPRNEIPQTMGFLCESFYRLAWGVCICWIIYACSHGYGGYINRFLSWKPFIPLGRLSYCAYLVSLLVMEAFHFSRRQPLYYNVYSMVYVFFGHAVMSLGVGFIWTILFESPFLELEKVICGKK